MSMKQIGEQQGPSRETDGTGTSLRGLLAEYDREVDASLRAALDAETGLERVRILHTGRRVITVHDAVLLSALCPLLEDLPGGREVADRLRRGCQQRAALLARFEDVTRNVAAPNVYPVSGDEIEAILEGLERSLAEHVTAETKQVGDVLTATADSADPDVVAARMAIEAESAPTRVHRAATKHPHSVFLKRYYHFVDRWADWRDTHNGWQDPRSVARSPRSLQVAGLMSEPGSGAPTIREVLAGYDATVEEVIKEWLAATTPDEERAAVRRLSAGIAVHDSVLGGVVCPLLDALPAAREPAAQLRDGCHQRSDLQHRLGVLEKRFAVTKPDDGYRAEVEPVVEALIESFHAHEHVETEEVVGLLETLPADVYRTKSSLLADAMWPWHSDGPDLLALRMAMWAEYSSGHSHPVLDKHPSSRVLRSWFHVTDHWRHFTPETPLERWLVPQLPAAPFSSEAKRAGAKRTGS